MYQGDPPPAERRAQALALDSSLLAELLGQADLRELLDPSVVQDTERELQRLEGARACRDAEDVADLLRTIGPLSASEVAQRCVDQRAAAAWLGGVAAQRRALGIRGGGGSRGAGGGGGRRRRDAPGGALPAGGARAVARPGAGP